jgi:hypothetical protein
MSTTIVIPEATYERLQRHATPFIDTPSSVIERLLDAYESGQSGQPKGSHLPEIGPHALSSSARFETDCAQKTRTTTGTAEDVYVNYGHGSEWRQWDDAREYGFICAGGGNRFSGPLFELTPTERLWVYVPRHGYVGVARIIGSPQRAREFIVSTPEGDRQPIIQVLGRYANDIEHLDNPVRCEYFVPVQWIQTVSLEEAEHHTDDFSNPAIVCRPKSLKWKSTLERLKKRFSDYNREIKSLSAPQ